MYWGVLSNFWCSSTLVLESPQYTRTVTYRGAQSCGTFARKVQPFRNDGPKYFREFRLLNRAPHLTRNRIPSMGTFTERIKTTIAAPVRAEKYSSIALAIALVALGLALAALVRSK
jgi:hypothetical protein